MRTVARVRSLGDTRHHDGSSEHVSGDSGEGFLVIRCDGSSKDIIAGPKDGVSRRSRASAGPTQLLPSMLVGGLILFYLAGLKYVSISSRYLVTFSPYLMIMATQSIRALSNGKWLFRKRMKLMGGGIACAMIVINRGAVDSRVKRCAATNAPRVAAGRWIADNVDRRSVVIGCAGGIRYFFDGMFWDYNLITLTGKDIEFAKRIRAGVRIEPRDYFYKKPDYMVIDRGDSPFGSTRYVVYQNDLLKIIRVARKDSILDKSPTQ